MTFMQITVPATPVFIGPIPCFIRFGEGISYQKVVCTRLLPATVKINSLDSDRLVAEGSGYEANICIGRGRGGLDTRLTK